MKQNKREKNKIKKINLNSIKKILIGIKNGLY